MPILVRRRGKLANRDSPKELASIVINNEVESCCGIVFKIMGSNLSLVNTQILFYVHGLGSENISFSRVELRIVKLTFRRKSRGHLVR
jgi:hypothetical protein